MIYYAYISMHIHRMERFYRSWTCQGVISDSVRGKRRRERVARSRRTSLSIVLTRILIDLYPAREVLRRESSVDDSSNPIYERLQKQDAPLIDRPTVLTDRKLWWTSSLNSTSSAHRRCSPRRSPPPSLLHLLSTAGRRVCVMCMICGRWEGWPSLHQEVQR